ncbi:uncharacterized protein MJAP1_001250 [Malassezia japonica]|uniref:Uncharacterized protein n=1 Tax=Malassezia japonica TaxID=223818 RepID=A0AAF0F1G4_9BASI|nr:uncharacterized protein MJAP1_001250 [Malassezia japonica]WFD38299.1 hypothetical protein MJAP1_001250 [Malassezia japonica]
MSQFVAYAGLLGTASACVYIGSYCALHTPIKTRELRKAAGKDVNEDEEEGQSQSLSSGNAYIFPVIGSAVLFSLYLAFKYFDKAMINTMLSAYFAFAGALAIPVAAEHLIKMANGGKVGGYEALLLRVRIPNPFAKKALEVKKSDKPAPPITDANVPGTAPPVSSNAITIDLLGLVLMGIYLYSRHWMLTNIVAVCFAIQGIMLITLDSFSTGYILLAGLFFYDIFWVFGSAKLVRSGPSVMVSVATNFDGPIKILCPKNLLEVASAYLGGRTVPSLAFALLGLGDIVIPGVFVALALRFDQKHASESQPSLGFTRFYYRFAKPYFTTCLAAYVGGLVFTMAVMHVFGAAQPALLYLSPACSLSVVFLAIARKELKEQWNWVDKTTEPTPPEKEKKAN